VPQHRTDFGQARARLGEIGATYSLLPIFTGGEGEIRTHGGIATTPVFKSPDSHSRTSQMHISNCFHMTFQSPVKTEFPDSRAATANQLQIGNKAKSRVRGAPVHFTGLRGCDCRRRVGHGDLRSRVIDDRLGRRRRVSIVARPPYTAHDRRSARESALSFVGRAAAVSTAIRYAPRNGLVHPNFGDQRTPCSTPRRTQYNRPSRQSRVLGYFRNEG